MAEQQWTAKICPELHPAAQELVEIYEATPGSTGPGCCPEALAAVLDYLLATKLTVYKEWREDILQRFAYIKLSDLENLAALLRGEVDE